MGQTLKYAYYPGCSLHCGCAQEYDASWRAVCGALGIELVEMENWNCCGTVHTASVDRLMSCILAARNLAIGEEMDLEIVAPCSGCYKILRTTDEALKEDADLRAKVNACLPHPFQGSTAVRHPLYVILQDIGLDTLANVPRPLHGLRVAPYYGCWLVRPPALHPVDSPENPQGLDRLLQTLGAEVIAYPGKTRCCGGAVLVSHTDVALDLTGRLLEQARRAGADCLAVACPMCQMALDGYQSRIERRLGKRFGLPILYFTQLMGLAMGIEERHLGLGRLFVSPTKALAQV